MFSSDPKAYSKNFAISSFSDDGLFSLTEALGDSIFFT